MRASDGGGHYGAHLGVERIIRMTKRIIRKGDRSVRLIVTLQISHLMNSDSDLLMCKCKCGQYCEVPEVKLLSGEITACPTCQEKKNPYKKATHY